MLNLEPALLAMVPYCLFRHIAMHLDKQEFMALAAVNRRTACSAITVWERNIRVWAAAGAKHDAGEEQFRTPVFRFLAPKQSPDWHGGKCVLASYPRCGNTLMRRLLEKATGVITGSDTRPDRTLSRSLAAFGLQGEGVTDFKRVLLVKTHWPERQGWKRFTAQRAILLVRNPFDAIDSYFNMALTNTHDKSLHEQVYRMFGDIWDGLVHNEMDIWQRFYEFWLSVKVPLLLVRYEDLVQHTDQVMARVQAFIQADARQLATGTFRINGSPSSTALAASDASQAGVPYKPRKGGRVGKGLDRLSAEQVTACMERAGHMIEAFGYDPRSQNFPHGHTTTQLQPLECCLRNVPIQDCAHQSGDMLHKVAGNGSDAALAVLHVNAGQLIRSADDMFGRRMTELRKQHTDNDTKPLPLAA